MNEFESKDVPDFPSFSKLSKDDISKRDIFGRTLLHLVILTNKSELLKQLLGNKHVKSVLNLCDFENGWNCLHYVIYHKRILCFRALLEYFRGSSAKQNSILASNSELLELLKSKDRSGTTPLQLLDNDFKDLVWIPEYINEKNEYHISYRFKSTKKIDEVVSTQETTEIGSREQVQKKRPSIKSPQVPYNPNRGGSEIYMFGNNSSNQLGLGDANDRSIPSKLSHNQFKISEAGSTKPVQEELQKRRFKSLAISKYHSIVLTTKNELFTCGKGSRGRLGHSNLSDCFNFKRVDLDPVKFFAIHNNHSVAVTFDNDVYTWGLNSYNQLGYDTTSKTSSRAFSEVFESTPTIVGGDLKKNSKEIIGVTTSKIHCVVYTESELFFWGLNIGQMGIPATFINAELKFNDAHYKGEIQRMPKSISLRDNIKLIETCELCTFVVTDKNDIHVYSQFHHYKLPKIPVKGSSDKHFDIFKPTRLTKAISISKIIAKNPEFCIILLDNGNVMSFSFSPEEYKNTKYSVVWKAYDHDMVVTDMHASYDGSIVLCTRNGSVFVKSSQSKQRKKSMSEAALPIPINRNKFKKIDNLNKVVLVISDPSFSSFGFIRDDIDILPLKLQKNDFINDLAYLSILNDPDSYRKQEQLLTLDHNYKTYVTSFFYPQQVHDELNEDLISQKQEVVDLLLDNVNSKYDGAKNGKPRAPDIYDLHCNTILETTVGLDSPISFLQRYSYLDEDDGRGYDCRITFKTNPDISIPVHKTILSLRSNSFRKIFDESNSDDLLIFDELQGKYNSQHNTLEIESPLQVISIILFFHFIYCSETLDIDEKLVHSFIPQSKDQDFTKRKRKILSEVERLKYMFNVLDVKARPNGVMNLADSYYDLVDDITCDVVVKLIEGEVRCHAFMLRTRSAYFETLLSDRWDNDGTEFLDFSDVKLTTFSAILKHIYGKSNEQILEFGYSFENCDEFINELLELIEVSDELLLFQLKGLCQAALSDMISLENVIILLAHADYLNAEKLFMNCCWYIYNNLEVLLFDSAFTDLSIDLMKKLEVQILYFQNCKLIDFADDKGTLNESMLINWFEVDADSLLQKFCANIPDYNEVFISDRKGYSSFEPLIDTKYEQVKDAKKKKERKNSRKSSTISTDILDFRNSIVCREGENYASSPILEDNNDFEVVQRGGRRKSKTNANASGSTSLWSLPSSHTSSSSSLAPSSSSALTISASASQSSSNGTNIANSSQFPTLGSSNSLSAVSVASSRKVEIPASPPTPGLSPFSNWASKSTGTPIFNDRPNNAEKVIARDSTDWVKKGSPSGSKIKIGPIIKLSQKERKKKLAMGNTEGSALPPEHVPVTVINPWSATPLGPADAAPEVVGLPVLGSSSRKVSKSKRNGSDSLPSVSKANSSPPGSTSNELETIDTVSWTPSLTEIMIEESLKIERARMEENDRRTLADIQKEQEFAKWWEEETLRVQKQMVVDSSEPTAKRTDPKKRRNGSASKEAGRNGDGKEGKSAVKQKPTNNASKTKVTGNNSNGTTKKKTTTKNSKSKSPSPSPSPSPMTS